MSEGKQVIHQSHLQDTEQTTLILFFRWAERLINRPFSGRETCHSFISYASPWVVTRKGSNRFVHSLFPPFQCRVCKYKTNTTNLLGFFSAVFKHYFLTGRSQTNLRINAVYKIVKSPSTMHCIGMEFTLGIQARGGLRPLGICMKAGDEGAVRTRVRRDWVRLRGRDVGLSFGPRLNRADNLRFEEFLLAREWELARGINPLSSPWSCPTKRLYFLRTNVEKDSRSILFLSPYTAPFITGADKTRVPEIALSTSLVILWAIISVVTIKAKGI